jgi:secondary thiamine-phosphate synthase enzyme
MRQHQHTLTLRTRGQGLYEVTRDVAAIVAEARIATGLATVFCRHTSASLLVQENADPDVQRDLLAFFSRLVPEGDALFVHRAEGPDDMPAHVKAALTQTSLAIPVSAGRLALGIWQGVYLFEHRTAPHARSLLVHVVGA